MDSTTSITTAGNQAAANKMEIILNRKNIKEAIARLAQSGTSAFQAIADGICDLSSMDDSQVRETVSRTFTDAKERLDLEIMMLNRIPSFRESCEAQSLEEAMDVFISAEKEILEDKDTNIIKRMLMMFWTGIKHISALIIKSTIAAAKFVREYGIRIIAAGLDFIVKIVQKTVKFFKTVMRVAAAVMVAIDGTEKEIIDVEAKECY